MTQNSEDGRIMLKLTRKAWGQRLKVGLGSTPQGGPGAPSAAGPFARIGPGMREDGQEHSRDLLARGEMGRTKGHVAVVARRSRVVSPRSPHGPSTSARVASACGSQNVMSMAR